MEKNKTKSLAPVAEITLSYNSQIGALDRPQVRSSQDVFEIFLHSWDMNLIGLAEQFKIMLLNRATRVLGIYTLSTGGMCSTVADPRLLFIAALKSGATTIILAHNHPSGNLEPSKSDEALTQKIVQAGRLLEITVTDHLILHSDSYYSFADNGLL